MFKSFWVMPSSFRSYGSKSASLTVWITAVSLVYLRLERPSTSSQLFHSFQLSACGNAYSLMPEANDTGVSMRYRSSLEISNVLMFWRMG